MSIAFFISGHGFGHASREVEVINEVLARSGGPIVIRSAVSPDLLRRTIRGPYTLVPGEADSGVVQTSSIAHDDTATIDAAISFYETFDARAEREAADLRSTGVSLVVGDIPPIAFEAAARAGVPSVAIANFTWDWIFDTHPAFRARAAWTIEVMRAAYGRATRALRLPFSPPFDVFPRVDDVPLIARHPTKGRDETREYFGLPRRGLVALLSFGGYGLPSVDLARVDARVDWTLATTDRLGPAAGLDLGHVRTIAESAFLDSAFRYEDLVAASDVVVSKPGYGILSECIAAGTPLVYTSRGAFREYDLLVAEMPRYVRCRYLSQRDLLAGHWRATLEAAIAQPPPPNQLATNGAEVAADVLLRMTSSM